MSAMGDFAIYVDEFTQAYAVAMLWANTDEIDDTGDRVESAVDPYAWQTPGRLWAVEAFDSDARAELAADCEAFVRANWSDLRALDATQCGHDFALTRNHHGAGFWDRGLGDVGDRLTESSHAYGESSGYFTTDETEVHLS